MADQRGETPDHIDDQEQLNRWFESRYFDNGEIQSSVFRSFEISVFREAYRSWVAVLAEYGKKNGMAQLVAIDVREIDGLELVKDEDDAPYGHALIRRQNRKRISKGQARKLRDAATLIRPPKE
jgi:hypothetical protein